MPAALLPLHLVFLGRADTSGPNGLTIDSNNRIRNRLLPFLAPNDVESGISAGPYIAAIDILAINYQSTDNQELTQLRTLMESDGTRTYLICRDSSITSSSRDDLWSILNYITGNNLLDGKDLFFLGKWMDNCMAHDPSGSVGMTNLVSNSTPVGFQAVLITPDCIPKILANTATKTTNLDLTLNEMIVSDVEQLQTLACTPNFFSYDAAYDSSAIVVSSKTQECGNPIGEFKPVRDEDLLFFWFLVIFIVVGLLAWIIYRLVGTIDYRFTPNVVKIPVPYVTTATA